MISSPSAIGSEMPSICTLSNAVFSPGIQRPSSRPATIAMPIHTGRNRSSAGQLARRREVSDHRLRATVSVMPRPQQSARQSALTLSNDDNAAQRLGHDRVIDPGRTSLRRQQSCVAQDLEVMRDRRLRHLEPGEMSQTHASPPAWLATELSRRSRTGSANALSFAAISTAALAVSGSRSQRLDGTTLLAEVLN